MKTILLISLLSVGCTAPLNRNPVTPTALPSVDCQALDNQHRTWGAIAKFSGALSGVGGLATVPISDEQKTLRFSVGISTAVLGAFAITAIYIEQDAASTWAKKCNQ